MLWKLVCNPLWVHSLYPVNFIKIGPVVLKYWQGKFLTSHNISQNKVYLYTNQELANIKNVYHMLWLLNKHHMCITKWYNERNVTQSNHIKWPYNIWVHEPCNNVTKFCLGHWTTKLSVQAFPASFRFYHCSLWDTSLNPRKFNIGLIQLNA